MDELRLQNGILTGDEETYVFLFKEYYAALCAYSYRYIGRKDVAEEIVSDVFMRIWEKRRKIVITDSVKAYLFQAVCNNSLYYLRNLKKEEKLELHLVESASEGLELGVFFDEINSRSQLLEDLDIRIEEAVKLLPPQQQKAFRYKRFEGKKNKEIADCMGLSVKTVEMHLSKAVVNLRTNLKDYLPAFLLFMLLK